MIYQNDPRLYEVIQKVGCFFMCCIMIAKLGSKHEYTTDEINKLWDLAKARGYINTKDEMINSVGVINLASDIKFKQVCHSYNKTLHPNADYYIQKAYILNPHKEPYHFRLMNRDGAIIYDPYNPSVEMGAEVYRRGYQRI